MPVNFLLKDYYNIEKHDNGPIWILRFQIAPLFPKQGQWRQGNQTEKVPDNRRKKFR